MNDPRPDSHPLPPVSQLRASRRFFFCGIGGSGMLPLALILRARGFDVEGSDRSLDAGRTAQKFEFLNARGIRLHPQDGSGLRSRDQVLVTSAAVEDAVPDVVAARRLGCPEVKRPELLAQLVNSAKLSVAVGGTSGKSTTTGMIAWILYANRCDPTVMNGAVMKNFVAGDFPFASAIVGEGDAFVSEVDESDGSISLYKPTIAVLNNIALDHKSLPELRGLFKDFISRAQTAIVNLDNDETSRLAQEIGHPDIRTYSLSDTTADFSVSDLITQPDGQSCIVTEKMTGERQRICLQVPGRHNLSNGLAAIAAARACGLTLRQATSALMNFTGIRRRLEVTGVVKDITVIDDFAHNPDKISATLSTLHQYPGRLLVMWQPHGYGPIRQMKDELIQTFVRELNPLDILLMPEPVYFGGTVDRSVGSGLIAEGVTAGGKSAFAMPDRVSCGDRLIELATPGDIIVVMGARDDTLSDFAGELLSRLGKKDI